MIAPFFKPPKPVSAPAHLAAVAENGCVVPGCASRGPVHVHHLLTAGLKAMSRKACDRKTVGLCLEHHEGADGVHQWGDEIAWAKAHGILDLEAIADSLAAESEALGLFAAAAPRKRRPFRKGGR